MKLPELLITRHGTAYRVLNLFTEDVHHFTTAQQEADFVFALPEYTARWAL